MRFEYIPLSLLLLAHSACGQGDSPSSENNEAHLSTGAQGASEVGVGGDTDGSGGVASGTGGIGESSGGDGNPSGDGGAGDTGGSSGDGTGGNGDGAGGNGDGAGGNGDGAGGNGDGTGGDGAGTGGDGAGGSETEEITCTGAVIDDDVQVQEQAELEALAGVGEITGNLRISGVSSLEALACLTTVGAAKDASAIYRGLWIEGTSLVNLDGLGALTSVAGELVILNNQMISSVSTLTSLQNIGLHLVILNNPLLVSVDNFSSLAVIGGDLIIGANDTLSTVGGFTSLTTVGMNIEISDNDSLVELRDLEGIESVGNLFFVARNPVLPTCEVERLRDAIGIANIGGDVTIQDNDDAGICSP